MSSVSASQSHVAPIWEFVACCRCHLPFSSETGLPPIPFWLTECGHIMCNAHLNSDQSCAQCGERGIQLMPLSMDLEPPMADWFQSTPHSMDALAHAVNFQQQLMAAEVRHYKGKYEQLHSMISRVKEDLREMKALRRENAELKTENYSLRHQIGRPMLYMDQQRPSDYINVNGKRPMTEAGNIQQSNNYSSSPRPLQTPNAPDRITLPAAQQPPSLAPHRSSMDSETVSRQTQHIREQRPGTGRFAQQYAYNPSPNTQLHAQQLSNVQLAPLRHSQQDQRRMMPPPPPRANASRMRNYASHNPGSLPQRAPNPAAQRSRAHPATSAVISQNVQPNSNVTFSNNSVPAAGMSLLSSSRGLNSTSRFKPTTVSQRFAPPTPVIKGAPDAVPPSARAPLRSINNLGAPHVNYADQRTQLTPTTRNFR